MGHLDGAHHHGSDGLGIPLAAGAGAVLVAAALPALIALLNAVLIAIAVMAGVTAAAAIAFLAVRVRHLTTRTAAPVPALPIYRPAAAAGLSAPRQRPALGPAPTLHVHFHGLSPEDVAAVIARHGQPVRASLEEE